MVRLHYAVSDANAVDVVHLRLGLKPYLEGLALAQVQPDAGGVLRVRGLGQVLEEMRNAPGDAV